MLSQVLSRYFSKEICKERIIINGVQLPKYRKWPMPLKEIQCIKEKVNILILPSLPYNESEISEIIDILRELIQRLNLNNYVFEDKIVMVKEDWLTVRTLLGQFIKRRKSLRFCILWAGLSPLLGYSIYK